jgi:hypothetical protein
MDKGLATSILNQALKINEELGVFDSIVSSIEDEATKKIYVKALGNLLYIVFDMIGPVVRE